LINYSRISPLTRGEINHETRGREETTEYTEYTDRRERKGTTEYTKYTDRELEGRN
jgi:hypothetical protein